MITVLLIVAGVALGSVLGVVITLVGLGAMHGHLRNTGESFGANINTELDSRLRKIEGKLDVLIPTIH